MSTSTENQAGNTLGADERLKSRKLIDQLFESGKFFSQTPFRLMWMEIPFDEKHPVQMGVTVPKRKMRKAHHRNRMKRLVRESYRINKHPLIEQCRQRQKGFAILFIAQSNSPLTFTDTQDKIILLLQRLIRQHATVE